MRKQRGDPATRLLRELITQASQLQLEAQVLEQQRAQLSLQHRVLEALCELLHSLRTGVVHSGWLGRKGNWLPEELPLLEELHESFPGAKKVAAAADKRAPARAGAAAGTRGAPSAATAATAVAGAGSGAAADALGPPRDPSAVFVAPPGEYLASMRQSFSQEPFPGATNMTLEQYAQNYAGFVKEMALNLSLAQNLDSRPRDNATPPFASLDLSSSTSSSSKGDTTAGTAGMLHPLQALRRLVLQGAHVANSLILLAPDDLFNKIRIANLVTLELCDDAETAWQRHCWLVDRLNITKEQEQALIAGAALFDRLIESVRKQRQALSGQHSEQQGSDMRLATGRALDYLQGQEDRARRLAVLMKKEEFLLWCSANFVPDVLDVVQVSLVTVLAWPHIPQIGLLGAVLLKRSLASSSQPHHHQQQQQEAAAASPRSNTGTPTAATAAAAAARNDAL